MNNGKGLTHSQARIGAAMEAIELAVAERFPAPSGLLMLSAAQGQELWDYRVTDLCPIFGRALNTHQPIPWVLGRSLEGVPVGVPAEAVFLPLPPEYGSSFLGSTSAGLASGNTREEAVAHALLELIERDVDSFETLRSSETTVTPGSLTGFAAELQRQIQNSGVRSTLGHVANEFGIPFFRAVVYEEGEFDPSLVGAGIGCHPDAEIAASKALLEAVQSRATTIHGGRDDLEDERNLFRKMTSRDRDALVARSIAADCTETPIHFDQIATSTVSTTSELLQLVSQAVAGRGFGPIIVYPFMSEEDAIQVVRVVVPGLENLTLLTEKIGPRLLRFSRELREAQRQ